MLGKFLRSKIAIVLAILGLLVLGAGIGQRTIWLPPATLTATAPAPSASAPLTVIGPQLLNTRDGQFTMTVKSDGPLQLAVARQDDILGWVGNGAYTEIGGADADFTQLAATSHKGEATVPNPAGSDMWVSEEKADGELSYTWQAPGRGDWALLLSVDGKAAAPTDISITVDNEAGTPWAVPLMIIGSALLALAALMFLIAPNKPKAEVAAGRRTAGRVPSDPATGALEVDKIVASRSAAKQADGPGAPATIDEARKAEADKAGPGDDSTDRPDRSSRQDKAAPVHAVVSGDATSALPLMLSKTEPPAASKPSDAPVDPVAFETETSSDSGTSDQADRDQPDNDPSDQDKPDNNKPDDNTPDNNNGGNNIAGENIAGKNKPAKSKPAKDTPGKDQQTEFRAHEGTVGLMKKRANFTTRWGAALAAVLVAGSLSPAVAADPTTPATSPSATAAATESAPATATAVPSTPGFPALLDSQVQRISSAVAAAVAAGDNAKNAQELEVRVSGMALEARTANYKIRAKVSKQAAMEPVNASTLLAKVVTTTETWPRSSMLVTQGENNALPQLLTLVQASPRENYKLIQATPLLPGQTFPKVDKEGTKELPLDAADGLAMSPADAIAALSDRLTKADSKFKTSFNDSVYIQSVLDTQATILKEAKDASYVFSHKADTGQVVNLRTADGGAMVVVGYNFGIDATSKENANLTVGDDAAVFTGGKETTKGFTLNYAEPVVMHIPPAGSDGKITILSATRNLVGGNFKK